MMTIEELYELGIRKGAIIRPLNCDDTMVRLLSDPYESDLDRHPWVVSAEHILGFHVGVLTDDYSLCDHDRLSIEVIKRFDDITPRKNIKRFKFA